MRLVQINAVFGEKSTGLIVRDIHEYCNREGVDSIVCYPNASAPGVSIGDKVSSNIHSLITRLWGIQGYGSIVPTLWFVSRLRNLRPDIVHLHNLHSNFINLPILIKYVKKHHIALVVTLHDAWYFTGKCFHFLDIDCQKWKAGCSHCPKRFKEIPSYLADCSSQVFRSKKRLFDYERLAVVGCSQWIAHCAEQSPIFRKAKIAQIYNGIDTSVFTFFGPDKRSQYELRGFTVMAMANKWFDSNNANLRTSVMKSLEPSDHLIIMGCKPDQLYSYKDDSRILTVGYVTNRQELAAWYRSVDVFLNITFVDTLPTVNMEAASCGIPVVTYDSGGSAELVMPGKTGFVVSAGDVEGVIASLAKIKKGEIRRQDCVKWAQSRFDRNKNYKLYYKLYQEVLGTR